MSILWFLFDWRGRIGLAPYRTALLGLLLVARMRTVLPEGDSRGGAVVVVICLIVSLSLDAKRLHDLNLSALWIVGSNVLGAAGVAVLLKAGLVDVEILTFLVRNAGIESGSGTLVPLAVTAFALGAGARSMILSTFKGTAGPNRFDYDPRAAAAERATPRAAPVDDARIDALIAQALAERQKQGLPPTTFAAAPREPRKTFGRRSAVSAR